MRYDSLEARKYLSRDEWLGIFILLAAARRGPRWLWWTAIGTFAAGWATAVYPIGYRMQMAKEKREENRETALALGIAAGAAGAGLAMFRLAARRTKQG